MTVSYLFGARTLLDPTTIDDFYHRYAAVRRAYAQASEWTGLSVDVIRTDELPEDVGSAGAILSLRLSVFGLGIHDALAERGIRPRAIAGVSLGAMIGACVAGAVDRRELFEMLYNGRNCPALPADAPAQGMAMATIPVDVDPADYCEPRRPGVYFSAEHGIVHGGAKRMFMLSGNRATLEELIEQAPPGTVQLTWAMMAAHSPLRQHEADFIACHIDKINFRDPEIAFCPAVRAGMATTAADVRRIFLRNPVEPLDLVAMADGLARSGTRVLVVLGHEAPQVSFDERIRLIHITEPRDLDSLTAQVRELRPA